MDEHDPRTIKCEPNRIHRCALCNMNSALSLKEKNDKKRVKASGNSQTAQATRHLEKEHSEVSDIESTISAPKVKI